MTNFKDISDSLYIKVHSPKQDFIEARQHAFKTEINKCMPSIGTSLTSITPALE